MNLIKSVTVIYFLFTSNIFCQEWASMTYSVDVNKPNIFRGVFKSEAKEDILLGTNCVDHHCIYKMTPTAYVRQMRQLGWEVSEEIEIKDKEGRKVIWFRRYN